MAKDKKKKTVINNKVVNAEEFESLEDPVDLELVRTTVIFPREQLRELRMAAAERGTSMAKILRGLLDEHLDNDIDEARERVEDYFSEILEGCGGIWGGFKLNVFLEKMSDKEIELRDLSNSEWRSVLVKLEDSGLNKAENASDYRNLFSDLNPSRKQQKDLRKLGHKLIKKQKDESIFG